MNKKFLKLGEVARFLRVSERSVFRYIHSGRLKATKVGYWRISDADLKKFIVGGENTRSFKKHSKK